jgi:hypothetical protein
MAYMGPEFEVISDKSNIYITFKDEIKYLYYF